MGQLINRHSLVLQRDFGLIVILSFRSNLVFTD